MLAAPPTHSYILTHAYEHNVPEVRAAIRRRHRRRHSTCYSCLLVLHQHMPRPQKRPRIRASLCVRSTWCRRRRAISSTRTVGGTTPYSHHDVDAALRASDATLARTSSVASARRCGGGPRSTRGPQARAERGEHATTPYSRERRRSERGARGGVRAALNRESLHSERGWGCWGATARRGRCESRVRVVLNGGAGSARGGIVWMPGARRARRGKAADAVEPVSDARAGRHPHGDSYEEERGAGDAGRAERERSQRNAGRCTDSSRSRGEGRARGVRGCKYEEYSVGVAACACGETPSPRTRGDVAGDVVSEPRARRSGVRGYGYGASAARGTAGTCRARVDAPSPRARGAGGGGARTRSAAPVLRRAAARAGRRAARDGLGTNEAIVARGQHRLLALARRTTRTRRSGYRYEGERSAGGAASACEEAPSPRTRRAPDEGTRRRGFGARTRAYTARGVLRIVRGGPGRSGASGEFPCSRQTRSRRDSARAPSKDPYSRSRGDLRCAALLDNERRGLTRGDCALMFPQLEVCIEAGRPLKSSSAQKLNETRNLAYLSIEQELSQTSRFLKMVSKSKKDTQTRSESGADGSSESQYLVYSRSESHERVGLGLRKKYAYGKVSESKKSTQDGIAYSESGTESSMKSQYLARAVLRAVCGRE
ncbi:hypothetical protein DFH09DRAFT_1275978 [Mycena vulgaris]|nr:hypothetical protein DFH09DRAFT_1275978 [Mycena vulgaris]